jgi:Tfp pilus assembly protein PilO
MGSVVRADRWWAIGAAAVAVLLVLVAWLFLVQPQQAETADLIAEREATDQRVAALQSRLRTLRQQSADLPAYRADLERSRQALPTAPALSDFLRDLQVSGERAGVTVTGFNVGNPEHATASGASVYSLAVTITVAGPAVKQQAFLDQLQQVQPRAVLIVNANLMPSDQEGTLADDVMLTLNVVIFIESAAAPAVAPTAAPTASPSAPAPATPAATAPAGTATQPAATQPAATQPAASPSAPVG